FFIFFFQAEDGIRDLIVTGVQTCALPIFKSAVAPSCVEVVGLHLIIDLIVVPMIVRESVDSSHHPCAMLACSAMDKKPPGCGIRSEERRVGKECRARRWG